MENASKALIIAGAILLAILLITLGIIVYRQASGVIDTNAMDEIAVSAFNSKFLQYEGDNVRGAQVNALLNTIKQNNLSNASDASKQVGINVWRDLSANDWINRPDMGAFRPQNNYRFLLGINITDVGKALTGKSYKVKCETDPKSGYVYNIIISPAT